MVYRLMKPTQSFLQRFNPQTPSLHSSSPPHQHFRHHSGGYFGMFGLAGDRSALDGWRDKRVSAGRLIRGWRSDQVHQSDITSPT